MQETGSKILSSFDTVDQRLVKIYRISRKSLKSKTDESESADARILDAEDNKTKRAHEAPEHRHRSQLLLNEVYRATETNNRFSMLPPINKSETA